MVFALLLVAAFFITGCRGGEVEEEVEAPGENTTITPYEKQYYLTAKENYEKLMAGYQDKITELAVRQKEYIEARGWYENQCQEIRERADKLNGDYNKVIIELTEARQQIDAYQRAEAAMMDEQKLWQTEYNELRVRLEEIKARNNYTVSTNLTAEKRAHFYEMYDIVYPELWWKN